MYAIIYPVDGWTDYYYDEESWNSELEDIAENTSYDIDIHGRTAIIDNGDSE